jgi:chemotaxis protein MotB
MISRFPNGRQQSSEISHAWLVTFADLIALLLAFFVMIYAAQKVEYGQWQAMVQSLSRSLSTESGESLKTPSSDENLKPRNPRPGADIVYLEALFNGRRSTEPAFAGVIIQPHDDTLVITLPAAVMFQPGRADPTAGAKKRIAAIADLLHNVSNRIDVYGHSDPAPPKSTRFESNRELSLARAEMVAVLMRQAGYARRIGAFGLGATRYGDLTEIEPESRRINLARRVDIVVQPARERR